MSGLNSPWYEQGGVIRFQVTSDDGTNNEWQWRRRMQEKGYTLGGNVDFRPPIWEKGEYPTSTNVVVFKGELFSDANRTTENVLSYGAAFSRPLQALKLGLLIRDKFTREDIVAMGLGSITIMHYPISDCCDVPFLLTVGGSFIELVGGWLSREYGRRSGFAFVE